MRKSYACASNNTKVRMNSGKRIKSKNGFAKSNQIRNAEVSKR